MKVSRAVRRGLGRAIAPGYPVLHIKYYRRCRPFLRNCSLSTNYSVVTWRCTTLSLNSHGESCCQSLAFSNRFRTIGTRQSLLLLPVHLRKRLTRFVWITQLQVFIHGTLKLFSKRYAYLIVSVRISTVRVRGTLVHTSTTHTVAI